MKMLAPPLEASMTNDPDPGDWLAARAVYTFSRHDISQNFYPTRPTEFLGQNFTQKTRKLD